MKANEKLAEIMKLPKAAMNEWIQTIHFEMQGIRPTDDREQRLAEIKDMIHTSFLGEMGDRYREFPISAEKLYDLVDELFIELGYPSATPRRKLTDGQPLVSKHRSADHSKG